MKKNDTHTLALALSCFGIAFGAVSPALATSAQDSGTVSAVGAPPSAPVTAVPAPGAPVLQPIQPGAAPQTQSPISVTPAPAVQPIPNPATPNPVTPSAMVSPTTSAPVAKTPVASPAAKPAPMPSEPLTALPSQDAATGTVEGTNVMGDTGARQKHSGTYYDSNAIVPDSDMARAGAVGPRKIDPATEPGQSFVVVEKTGSASSFEAQYTAATRALKLGRYAAAMEMFEKLYKKNHKDPRILMGLAIAQQGAGFRESAAGTYEDLLKIQPNNADALVNLMGIMRAQYPSVTLKKLGDLRTKFPNNPGIPAQMGLVNADLNNYDDAIRDLEIAASMEPTNPSHVYNMAIISDRAGNVSGAIKLYEQALQLDSTYGSSASSLPREQIYDRLVMLRRKV